MNFKGILFDYGHTLVWFPHYREIQLISVRNIQRKLRTLGFLVEISSIQAQIDEVVHRKKSQSGGIEEEFREILSGLGITRCDEDDLQQIIELHWHPYVLDAHARKGVKELLNYLKSKGFRLGIVANIWSGGMNPALQKLGLDRFFDVTIASVDAGCQKPDPAIFQLALKRLELRVQETLMVGDNPSSDIQGAHNLGICTVRLMRGPNRTKLGGAEADFKIRNLQMLRNIVC